MKITIAYENGPASPLLTPIVIGVHYGTIAADDVVLLTGVKGRFLLVKRGIQGGWWSHEKRRDVLNGTSLSLSACGRGRERCGPGGMLHGWILFGWRERGRNKRMNSEFVLRGCEG
jgi:hypothetical protein